MFDLKEFRQKILKMTQEEFAQLIGERQDYVSRLEKNPELINLHILQKIANATGTSLDELVQFKKMIPEALKIKDTWDNLRFTKKTIIDYIQQNIKTSGIKEDYSSMITDLKSIIQLSIVKPTVAIVGMSDSGKSTLINSLLGLDKMPTSWSPTTAISVYLKHIDDKPSFVDDEVWIFKSQVGDEIGWDAKKYEDEKYCSDWKLASGSVEMLPKYAIRQEDKEVEAGAAVVYLDSPILKVCDIVDLPGFGTGDRDTDDILTEKAKNYADIIIYMSIANGFLRGTDIEFLKSAINNLAVIENKDNNLSPLSNLFVVASHAHVVNGGNQTELNKILNTGSLRLYKQIPEEIWVNKNDISGFDYNENVLRERFFTYTTNNSVLRDDFDSELKEFIESYPTILNDNVKLYIKEFIKTNELYLDRDIEQYYSIINEREQQKALLQQYKDNEPNRINESQKLKQNVLDEIHDFHNETSKMFIKEYDEIISIENIVDVINSKGYKKKKEDLELLAGFLSSKLQARLQSILKRKSIKLNEVVDNYIEGFNAVINDPIDVSLQSVKIPFDVKRAFVGGLAGLATFGGLAVWASTLGNLGGYILVAKGVSVLSALGISVAGGTAGAASAVAALGGPIVLGIALAVIVSIAAFSLFGDGWKKSVAKKMIKEYEKQDAVGKFNEVIDGFWQDTETAFGAAADNLEEKYQQHIKDLEEMVTSNNIEEIEEYIRQAKEMKDFFGEIPL